jgi:hypothetical protein
MDIPPHWTLIRMAATPRQVAIPVLAVSRPEPLTPWMGIITVVETIDTDEISDKGCRQRLLTLLLSLFLPRSMTDTLMRSYTIVLSGKVKLTCEMATLEDVAKYFYCPII